MARRRSKLLRRNGRRISLAAALVVFAVSLFAHQVQTKTKPADQVAAPNQKPIRHEVGVTLKLIQVIVTGKDGKPIPGLKKEDFVLLDNGEEKKLTEFESYDLKYAVPSEKAGETKIAETALPSPRLLNRKIIFLFDFATGTYSGDRKAAEAALNFIDTKLLPGDELGVVTLSFPKGLWIPELSTTDHRKIRSIIASFGLYRGAGSILGEKEKTDDQLAAGAAPDARMASPLTRDRIGTTLIHDRRLLIKSYFSLWTALAQALRYLPGKKSVILFSAGMTTGQLKAGHASPSQADLETDLRRALTDIHNELASASVSVYSIYTGEMTAALEMRTTAASLMEMSDTTGGKYFGYAQSYKDHFEEIQTLTGSYYVLGYPISERWDGAYHKIKVSVKRPDCIVRAQTGYLNPKEFGDYTDLEKQVQLVDLALAEKPVFQEPLRFTLAGLTLSSESADNIGIAAEIPLELMRGEGMGRVEIFRLAFNEAGEIVDSRRTEEDVRAIAAPTAVLASFLSAPPGPVKCRVVIRDMDTGKAAVAGCAALATDPAKPEIRLDPPLLLKAGKGRAVFKEPKPVRKGGPAPVPTPAQAFFLEPARDAPDFPAALKSGTEVRAVLPCLGPAEILAKVALTLTLHDEFKNESKEVPLVVDAEKTAPGSRIFLIHFRVPEVEPDDYLLIFGARGPDGPLAQIVRRFGIASK